MNREAKRLRNRILKDEPSQDEDTRGQIEFRGQIDHRGCSDSRGHMEHRGQVEHRNQLDHRIQVFIHYLINILASNYLRQSQ